MSPLGSLTDHYFSRGYSSGIHISFGRPKFAGNEELINVGDRDFCIRALKEGFATITLEQREHSECGISDRDDRMCFKSAMTALL